MTNSVSSNRPEKYNIAAFFSGNVRIELGFEQTNEFRVVYANEFDKYVRKFICLIKPFVQRTFLLSAWNLEYNSFIISLHRTYCESFLQFKPVSNQFRDLMVMKKKN